MDLQIRLRLHAVTTAAPPIYSSRYNVHTEGDAMDNGFEQAFGELHANTMSDWSKENKLAKRWGLVHLALGIPAAILSAAAGITGLAISAGRVPAAIIALVAAAVSASSAFLQPGVRQQHHLSLQAEYSDIWHRVRVLILIDLKNPDWEATEARTALQELSREYHAINRRRAATVRLASAAAGRDVSE